jgi:curved DNA-binding protein CbpA
MMTMPWKQDPYEILQISPNAEAEVIEAAYKRLARKYHPDTNHSSEAKERMQALNWAYEILGDPDKRREYDVKRRKSSPAVSPQPRQAKQPSSKIDDITQQGLKTHSEKIERSKKVKELQVKLDPIVRAILHELGNAQSKWLKETKRTPDRRLDSGQAPTSSGCLNLLVLLSFVINETSIKYNYRIHGHFGPASPYDSYSWNLDWKRFYGFGYTVHLTIRSDGIATLGMQPAYWQPKARYTRYTTPSPILDVEHLPLLEIKDQLQAQASLVYREKIGAF